MEKLIKYLNDYEKWKWEEYWRWNYVWWINKKNKNIFASRFPDWAYICEEESRAIIICKGYEFIKWLVDNDKIDWLKFYGENEYTPIWVNAKSDIDQVYSVEEQILMTLAISDTPIEDLISYLK